MKDSRDVTIFAQCLSMIRAYAISAGTAFLFGTIVFWWFLTQPIWGYIFSAVFAIVNFCFVYSAAHSVAKYDSKPYSHFTPKLSKSILMTASIWAVTIILWALFETAWRFAAIDGYLFSLTGTIINFLFSLWVFPFRSFVNVNMGGINYIGMIVVFAVPLAASIAGYFSGMKNFVITEKIVEFVYEKKD